MINYFSSHFYHGIAADDWQNLEVSIQVVWKENSNTPVAAHEMDNLVWFKDTLSTVSRQRTATRSLVLNH